jgi:hypothetical protein
MLLGDDRGVGRATDSTNPFGVTRAVRGRDVRLDPAPHLLLADRSL